MPGILIMNDSGATAASGPHEGENKKRFHDGKLVNGNTPRREPASANSQSGPPPVNGAAVSASGLSAPTLDQLAQLPPEIRHIASEFYHPLGKMLVRIAQECYNQLSEVITNMAEMPSDVYPSGAMSNGIGSYANLASSDANKQKKLKLLKFAQEQRGKFIKLLVLTDWGRRSSIDVCKLVDLFQWTKDQQYSIDSVDIQMLSIKMESNRLRQANPDIRTALQVLSTGKAAWIPDMGFIPPEPMSPEKALNLLRYLNTTLSIRLNVHENLPRHLRKWHVKDGRVTFVVDDEFELDVLCYSEDISDNWVFVDVRLLFSPAPSIPPDGPFFQHFRTQLDHIFSQSGLRGGFDFLHNFILTHKIALLKKQAHELLRKGWAGSIKIEPVHRGLVIQYWIEKPEKKSWIEIGVSSNKPKNGKLTWRGPPISSLAVRWFRSGIEVTDVSLNTDWKAISMERMLKKVIALHVGHIFRAGSASIPPQMTTKATLSETEPCDCALEVSLGTPDNKTTVSFEPVTGKYTLKPVTFISAREEHAINRGKELGVAITHILSETQQDLVQRHAQQLGWKSIAKHALRTDVVKEAVRLNVLRFSMYWPTGWTTNWALAAIIDASGASWWIVELGARGSAIVHAEPLKVEKRDKKPSINRATLSSIERIAVQLLSFRVTIRELEAQQKANSLQTELSVPRRTVATQTFLRGWVLHLKTVDLVTSKRGEDPWLEPAIRLTCQGFRSDVRNIWHIASGTMVKSVAADMQKLMSASPQKNFTFSSDGNFSILLSTPFGKSVFEELKRRLRDLGRLRSFTSSLQKRKMKLKSSSLQQVEFQYSTSFTTTVNFGQENDVKVSFSPGNPHNRIIKLLTEIINERSSSPPSLSTSADDHSALDRFCNTLLFTRPILTTLVDLESAPGNIRNPAIHTHAVGKYRLTYSNPLCSFDIRIRYREDEACWLIEDNNRKPADVRPTPERSPTHERLDSLKSALGILYKGRGEGWYGISSGIIAEVDGIPAALRSLHETVLGCAMAGGYKPSRENGGWVAPIPTPAPTQTQPQVQIQTQGGGQGQGISRAGLGNGSVRGPGQGGINGNGSGHARQQPNGNGNRGGNQMMNKKQQQEVIELD